MNKNQETFEDFAEYVKDHPELRFWQALRNWSGAEKIEVDGVDTFYFTGRDT